MTKLFSQKVVNVPICYFLPPKEESIALQNTRELMAEQSPSECCSLHLLRDPTLWYKAVEFTMNLEEKKQLLLCCYHFSVFIICHKIFHLKVFIWIPGGGSTCQLHYAVKWVNCKLSWCEVTGIWSCLLHPLMLLTLTYAQRNTSFFSNRLCFFLCGRQYI